MPSNLYKLLICINLQAYSEMNDVDTFLGLYGTLQVPTHQLSILNTIIMKLQAIDLLN